jgi:hypothetical protein
MDNHATGESGWLDTLLLAKNEMEFQITVIALHVARKPRKV